jgi:hypothetical protein
MKKWQFNLKTTFKLVKIKIIVYRNGIVEMLVKVETFINRVKLKKAHKKTILKLKQF